MKWLSPLLSLLEKLTALIIRLIGLNTKWDRLVTAVSAAELETLIETGGVSGLKPDERNILEGVFALRDNILTILEWLRIGNLSKKRNGLRLLKIGFP